MRFRPATIVGAALGLALIAASCGGDGAATAGGGEATTRVATKQPAPAPASGAAAKRSRAERRCARTLGEFLDALESLANSLAVGLDYERYLGAVKRVRGAYSGLDPDRPALACVARVAGPAERSLNLYLGAANAWGECLADSSCEAASIEARLQRRWRAASAQLARARDGLRGLG